MCDIKCYYHFLSFLYLLFFFLSLLSFFLPLSVCLSASLLVILPTCVSNPFSPCQPVCFFFAILLLCLFGSCISSVFPGSSLLSFSWPSCLSLALLFVPVCLAVSSCLSPCLSVPEWAPLSAFFYLSVLQKNKKKIKNKNTIWLIGRRVFCFCFFFLMKRPLWWEQGTQECSCQIQTRNYMPTAGAKKKKNKKKIVRGSEASNKIKAKARNIQSYSF